jgi:hypothetical protein
MGLRYSYYGFSKDGNGKIICGATVSIFLTGTSTPTSVYEASLTFVGEVAVNYVTTGLETSSSPGYFIFYIDRANYAYTQEFDITMSKVGFTSKTFYNIKVFSLLELSPVTTLTTQGDILYQDDSGLQRLPSGTPGYHLTTQGAGANPAWTNSVNGFSGLLADDQHVLDTEVVSAAKTIKLDDFSSPDNNTDLNVSITAHGLCPIAPNDTTKVLRGGATPAWGYDKVVQEVNTQTGEVATGTTAMVYDDTIPQKTAGDQYLSSTITPKSATNKLKIDVILNVAYSNDGNYIIAGLFQDDLNDALSAAMVNFLVKNKIMQIIFSYYMTAGTTSATTFKVRAGGDSGGATVTVNGTAGDRKLGGVLYSSITITEISA